MNDDRTSSGMEAHVVLVLVGGFVLSLPIAPRVFTVAREFTFMFVATGSMILLLGLVLRAAERR